MMRRKHVKGLVGIFLFMILLVQSLAVNATEPEIIFTEDEITFDDMEDNDNTDISTYTMHITGAAITLKKMEQGVFGMRSQVFCNTTMRSIVTTFTLQKKSGSSWVSVGSGSVSQSNSDHMYKSMTASGVSSGTYRCVASTRVTNNYGFSETVSVTSGNVVM